MCNLLAVDSVYDPDVISINAGNIFSSPVVCLCHALMSVVDRAPAVGGVCVEHNYPKMWMD